MNNIDWKATKLRLISLLKYSDIYKGKFTREKIADVLEVDYSSLCKWLNPENEIPIPSKHLFFFAKILRKELDEILIFKNKEDKQTDTVCKYVNKAINDTINIYQSNTAYLIHSFLFFNEADLYTIMNKITFQDISNHADFYISETLIKGTNLIKKTQGFMYLEYLLFNQKNYYENFNLIKGKQEYESIVHDFKSLKKLKRAQLLVEREMDLILWSK